jgi:hypothetical protein
VILNPHQIARVEIAAAKLASEIIPDLANATPVGALAEHPPARRRYQIPIAPAATSVPNFPRLRALALFGRRPPQRVEEFVMPASKNLHNSEQLRSLVWYPRNVADVHGPG